MRDERVRKQAPVTSNNKKHKLEFTPDDAKDLLEHAEHILAIESGSVEETWEAWAKAVGLSFASISCSWLLGANIHRTRSTLLKNGKTSLRKQFDLSTKRISRSLRNGRSRPVSQV